MDTIFPFGFPHATAFYLVLYIVAWVVHAIFMSYVFAGTAYLMIGSFRRWQAADAAQLTTYDLLRDWMPFALGTAITAGIAPLLFVQVLYKQNFYTANALLFHRWMIILPALVAAFYSLYVLKVRPLRRGPLHAAVAVAAFACVAFTGIAWAENHQLSLDQGAWPDFYVAETLWYRHPAVVPRAAIVFALTLPTLGLLVSWQLLALQRRGKSLSPAEPRALARLGTAGLLAGGMAASWWWMVVGDPSRSAAASKLSSPYLMLFALGVVLQFAVWIMQWGAGTVTAMRLAFGSGAVLATWLGLAAVRESVRLASIDVGSLFSQHAKAAKVGGFPVFCAFLGLNVVVIAICLCLVHSGLTNGHKSKP